ncbi:O-antigen ligase family protein [Patescibacteria group bacterium]|nr:O-antigen ligase family protein [Patescibacteria group bacterium]MBU1922236.1 O-antigen ligase family protein [Patescibacteria group bacterium]
MGNIDSKTIIKVFCLIALFELVSFCTHLAPGSINFAFIALSVLFLIIALKNPSAALLISLAELFIGGKGYLFAIELDGAQISIRMAMFIILFAVWLISKIKNRSIALRKSRFFTAYVFLIITIFLGLLNGLARSNGFADMFFDFNAYIFLAYLPIYYDFIKDKAAWGNVFNVFIAALVWLFIKTMIVLYFFSHALETAVWPIYHWIRNTGVGEITLMTANIYRTFFQSHIYSLIGLVILTAVLILYRHKLNILQKKVVLILMAICSAAVLISLSRSFWAGALCALLAILVLAFYKKIKITRLLGRVFLGFFALAFGFVILLAIVRFPIPEPTAGNLGSLLMQRSDISAEAAAASRWNLLPKLWQGIWKNPIIGTGFGAKITYISNDPRVRAYSASGEYTTYAFEWGLLDIWYKIGLLGVLAYVWLILKIIKQGIALYIKKEHIMPLALCAGLIALFTANFFTPYLNHPLGIGYIMLVSRYIDWT